MAVLEVLPHGAALDYFISVNYENLVTSPEPTLREVCSVLLISWDPQSETNLRANAESWLLSLLGP